MMAAEVGPGTIIRTGSFAAISGAKVRGQDWAEFTFKAPKGRRFVLLFLGAEAADGSAPMDPNEALKALGWTPPPAEEPAAPYFVEGEENLVLPAGE
jgi:hypothetical protein